MRPLLPPPLVASWSSGLPPPTPSSPLPPYLLSLLLSLSSHRPFFFLDLSVCFSRFRSFPVYLCLRPLFIYLFFCFLFCFFLYQFISSSRSHYSPHAPYISPLFYFFLSLPPSSSSFPLLSASSVSLPSPHLPLLALNAPLPSAAFCVKSSIHLSSSLSLSPFVSFVSSCTRFVSSSF